MLKRREWLESAMQNHDEYEFLDRQYNFALKAQRSVQQVEANSQDKVNRIRKIESLLEDSEDLCAHENVLEKVGRLYIRTDSDNYISKLKEDLENMTFEHSGVLEQGERLRDKLVHAQSDLNEALAEAPLYSLQRALARQRRLGRGGGGGEAAVVVVNSWTEAELQRGPTCGLVSLAVAGRSLGLNTLTADSLLQLGRGGELSTRASNEQSRRRPLQKLRKC